MNEASLHYICLVKGIRDYPLINKIASVLSKQFSPWLNIEILGLGCTEIRKAGESKCCLRATPKIAL